MTCVILPVSSKSEKVSWVVHMEFERDRDQELCYVKLFTLTV